MVSALTALKKVVAALEAKVEKLGRLQHKGKMCSLVKWDPEEKTRKPTDVCFEEDECEPDRCHQKTRPRCTSKLEEKCTSRFVDDTVTECREVTEQQCSTRLRQECSTKHEQQCHTEYDTQTEEQCQ